MTTNTENTAPRPDMPLPDESLAWQKMELLLDKEKRRPVAAWLWLTGAAGLVAALVAGLLLFGVSAGKPALQTAVVEERPGSAIKENEQPPNRLQPLAPGSKVSEPSVTVPDKNSANHTASTTLDIQPKIPIRTRPGSTGTSKKAAGKKTLQLTVVDNKSIKAAKPGVAALSNNQPVVSNNGTVVSASSKSSAADTVKNASPQPGTAKEVALPPATTPDSVAKKAVRKKPWVLTAGIGLQQPIAVANQQPTAYTYRGKNGSLSDYIPAIYVAVQKGAWQLQAEAMYAVPQPVAAFAFSQTTTYNAAQTSLNTRRLSIQKIYYHQLPVLINYQVAAGFFVGAGGQYNRLSGAVTQQQLTVKNVTTNTEAITQSQVPVRGFTDSFLHQTTTSLLLQTGYRWRRLSVALRYTKNLQPFIKYTTPTGDVLAKKNEALQAIIRFQLWRKEKQ